MKTRLALAVTIPVVGLALFLVFTASALEHSSTPDDTRQQAVMLPMHYYLSAMRPRAFLPMIVKNHS